jgi:lysophospholipase L1-like esterase
MTSRLRWNNSTNHENTMRGGMKCMIFLAILIPLAFLFGIWFQRGIGLHRIASNLGMGNDVSLSSHQLARIESLRQLKVPEGAVVFLGDSLLDSYEWQEVLPEKTVVKRTVSGAMTKDFIGRFDLSRADVIICLLGANDLGRGRAVEDFIKDYALLLDQIGKQSKVHVLALPPIRAHGGKPVQAARVQEFNERLRRLTTENEKEFLDVHAHMEDAPEQYLADDGLHLCSEGYRTLTMLIRAALNAPPIPPADP